MTLSTLSIRRPVLTVVLSVVVVLFGAIGYTNLGVREYPSVDPPVITVTTDYPGANAEVVESQVTEPIEESVNGIAGIKSITSISNDGRSTIKVEFNLSVDLETAANDVRDKVSTAVGRIPPDAEPPVVNKADADANAIIFLTIQSDERSLLELTDIAENVFKERLQTIDGVSRIAVWGSKRYSMRLQLDAERLAAYGLTPLDVRDALQAQNVELPSGRVEGANTELSVRTEGRLRTPEDFNRMVIKEEGDQTVQLRDLGEAVILPQNERTLLRRDGVSMVGNGIYPQPGANYIAISDEVQRRVKQIERDLPEDIQTGFGFDSSTYIRQSVAEVQQSIAVAFALVALVIFAFLRDWRTTVIPVLVIPIALVGTFFILYAFDYSINVLTLLGLVLAIGLVVDDAIVVLENIYAKIESGMDPMSAGLKGSGEIFLAVVSTTLALVAVFFPIVFLQGLTGRLFREFGVTIAGAVVISSFVALTLTPMLSTRILKRRERHNAVYRATEPFFQWLTEGYAASLSAFMRFRWASFLILIALSGGVYSLYLALPSELAPTEDRGMLRFFGKAPEGSSYEYMDRYVRDLIEAVKEEVPESERRAFITVTSPGFGASTSVNSVFARLALNDASQRTRSQEEIMFALTDTMRHLPEAQVFISQPASIGQSGGGLPVQFVIQNGNFQKIRDKVPEFVRKAGQRPELGRVDVDLKFTKPELMIDIDREKALALGVSVKDIAETLQLGLSGQRFGYFLIDGKQYWVIGQVRLENRNDPRDISSLYVRSESGALIQMDNLVSLDERSTPPQLFRYNRLSSATVSASLTEGMSLSDGIAAMRQVADEVLDESFSTELAGQSLEFVESSNSLLFAFVLAITLVYLILAAQFESFRDPLVIMLTVPLAVFGALLSLWQAEETLNVFSQIGIIMLVGLVTKNAILIVEFANQQKAEGLNRFDAVVKGAALRFRAILMTAASTVLGTLPIALALGAGSESRVSMGVAVVGGMLLSTGLTLYLIPAVYSLVSEKEKAVSNVAEEVKEQEEELAAS